MEKLKRLGIVIIATLGIIYAPYKIGRIIEYFIQTASGSTASMPIVISWVFGVLSSTFIGILWKIFFQPMFESIYNYIIDGKPIK